MDGVLADMDGALARIADQEFSVTTKPGASEAGLLKAAEGGAPEEAAGDAAGKEAPPPYDTAVLNTLYLTILSRYPTDTELRAITEYAQAGGVNRRGAAQDLAWALINSAEFGFRH